MEQERNKRSTHASPTIRGKENLMKKYEMLAKIEKLERVIIENAIAQRGRIDVTVPPPAPRCWGHFSLTGEGGNGKFTCISYSDDMRGHVIREIAAKFVVTETGAVEWEIELPAPMGGGNQSGTFPMVAIFIL